MSEQAGRETLLGLLALKGVLRQGWTRHPIAPEAVESVADHSYGLALLAWVLCPDGLNRERVMELALIHDLPEVTTGDLTPADNVPLQDKRFNEVIALRGLTKGLPQPVRKRAALSLTEYHAQRTPEARFVRAVDKLEMALQSLAYEEEFGLDLSEFRDSAMPALREAGLAHWVEAP